MHKSRIFCIVKVLSVSFLFMAVVGLIFAQTEKGIELYHSWQYQEAEKVLRDALQTDPQDVRASFYLGLSILLEQKYSEALDIFLKLDDERRTQTTVPDTCQLQIALARAHLGLKEYPEAWKNLEAAKKDNAYSPDVYVYRGVYYLQQDKAKAIKVGDGLSLMRKMYAHYRGHAYLRSGTSESRGYV
jgi:tetratricopeptide (TPR) repeat protein